LGVAVRTAPCRVDHEIEAVMAGLAREEHGGLLVLPENFMVTHRVAVITLAARYHLPAVYPRLRMSIASLKMTRGPTFPSRTHTNLNW
jgi:hypothetical protein